MLAVTGSRRVTCGSESHSLDVVQLVDNALEASPTIDTISGVACCRSTAIGASKSANMLAFYQQYGQQDFSPISHDLID